MVKTVLSLVCCACLVVASLCCNVVRLSFDDVYNDVVKDSSSSLYSNDGRIHECAQVTIGQLATREMTCAPYLRLNSGYLTFDGRTFQAKPMSAVTMATWVKLSTISGDHSIFCTIGGKASTHTQGQYHFEVNNGGVRWFHRNERDITVFSVQTAPFIQPNTWTHIAGTYNSQGGVARVYVNSKLIQQSVGSGTLSQDWEKFAGIGRQGHTYGRRLGGYIDEFNMFDNALSAQEIKKLYAQCRV